MTDNDDRSFSPNSDSEVLHAAFSAGAQERVPARLDKIVMRIARSEVRKDATPGWFAAWGRPVAFFATAGLSLALLIELQQTAIDVKDGETAPVIQQEFAREAAASSARMRKIGRTTEHRFLGDDPDSGVGAVPVGSNALAGHIGGESHSCGDDQIRIPATWMECVARLRAAGFALEADAEMERLALAYPDFAPDQ